MESQGHGRNAGRLVWTVAEAARLLGISRAHAYELIARDELTHIRLGRRIVVPKRALDELIAGTNPRADYVDVSSNPPRSAAAS